MPADSIMSIEAVLAEGCPSGGLGADGRLAGCIACRRDGEPGAPDREHPDDVLASVEGAVVVARYVEADDRRARAGR